MSEMSRDLIFWPVAAHFFLLVFLYAWLSLVRFEQRAGKAVAGLEARISANLSNQFEAPLLFYAIIILLWTENLISLTQLVLAWLFIAGRLLHTAIHTLTSGVILRGMVFMINFVAVFGLWGLFLKDRLFGG
ncbi:MAPEG family protein [Parvularcula sp. IMCC14364]|uniref:MAPEG family protein n=1 Tax=Parvularcula sp. IMCC14364 TaxID=3067902 RepID=UPI00274195F1|nr:MAPEG family protein [Parvularcula sp. IMCC14364]